MALDDLCWMSATELASPIRSKKISPVEATKAVLARIESVNPRINAFCTVAADRALAQAQMAEAAVTKGDAPLIVTRTEGGPAREVTRTGKRAHIHANLRDDDLRGALIDPGNAIQPRPRVGKRGDHRLHLSAQNPNGFVQIVEVR